MNLMRSVLIVLLAGGFALHAGGCRTRSITREGKKYELILSRQILVLPARAVEVADATLQDLRMRQISRQTTNIDGEYFFRSALGREYRLVIAGVLTDRTVMQIYGTDAARDRTQATLIFEEILSRLVMHGPEPTPRQQR